jgi:hypothetical protein
MSEWEIDIKKPLVEMLLWNLKTLSHKEKKQDFLVIYIMESWKIEIEPKKHSSF